MMDAVLLSSLLFLRLLSGVTATEVNLHKDGEDVPTEQWEHFKGRTSLSNEGLTKGNLSLNLSPLKLNDSGRYRCSFFTGTLEKTCYVNLTFEDPEVVGSHVPVTAVVGDDVILPCHLEPPFDVHSLTVEWKHNKMTVHLYRSRNDDPDSQDESYKGRTALFHDEMVHGNISLKLMNVTENDTGIYTCLVRQQMRKVKNGNITLNVESKGEEDRRKDDPTADPEEDGNNLSSSDNALATGIIIAIAFIYFVRKRNQQPQRQNNVNPPPAEQVPLQERLST